MLWEEFTKYYPGTITYTNSDGTFAVKFEWADDHGKNEETKHKSHVSATQLRVRERLGRVYAVCVCLWGVCGVCAVCVCVCVWLFPLVVGRSRCLRRVGE